MAHLKASAEESSPSCPKKLAGSPHFKEGADYLTAHLVGNVTVRNRLQVTLEGNPPSETQFYLKDRAGWWNLSLPPATIPKGPWAN